jgi:ribosomal protein L19E
MLTRVDEIDSAVRAQPLGTHPDLEEIKRGAAKMLDIPLAHIFYSVNYISEHQKSFAIDQMNYLILEEAIKRAFRMPPPSPLPRSSSPDEVEALKKVAELEAEMKKKEEEVNKIRAANSQLKEQLEATRKTVSEDPKSWTVAEVIVWLKQKPFKAFDKISQKFEEENIIGEVFLELKEKDLIDIGVSIMGDRKIVLQRIEDAKKIAQKGRISLLMKEILRR